MKWMHIYSLYISVIRIITCSFATLPKNHLDFFTSSLPAWSMRNPSSRGVKPPSYPKCWSLSRFFWGLKNQSCFFFQKSFQQTSAYGRRCSQNLVFPNFWSQQKTNFPWKFPSTLGSTLGNSASISLLPFKERLALGLPLSKAHSIKDETILENPGIQKWPVR